MSDSRLNPRLPSFDPFNATPIESILTAKKREQIYLQFMQATTPPNTMCFQQLGKPSHNHIAPQTPEQKQILQVAPNAPQKQPNPYAQAFYAAQAQNANVSRRLFFPAPAVPAIPLAQLPPQSPLLNNARRV